MEHQVEVVRHPESDKLPSWRLVWVKPRHVIRQWLDSNDPEKHAIGISMVAGMFESLNRASTRSVGEVMSLPLIFVSAIVGGAIGGLLMLYLFAAILRVTGGWLGGNGSRSDLRVALVSGCFVPMILIGLLWIPELLLFGSEMFTSETPRIDSSLLLTILFYSLLFLEAVLAIWAFVITLKSVGEAHGFSAWKALLTVVIPLAALFGVILLFGVLFSIF
jgi:hypothetical protein